MSLASLAADLLALSGAQGAPQLDEEVDTGPIARGVVDYVLSEAEGDTDPEDIGVAIAIAASAIATEHELDEDEVLNSARTYLRQILSGTAL